MIKATQAISSQYYPTQLWSVPAVENQQTFVCEHALELLGQALSPMSPAVIWCQPESTTIGIDRVRQLQEQLGYSSGSLRYIFILFADRLTTQAQHAVLKLLEEPPSNTQIVLVSNKPHALLSTIRSRCSETQVSGVADTLYLDSSNLYAAWKQLSVSEAIITAAEYKKREVALPLLESLVAYLRTEALPSVAANAAQLRTVLVDIALCLQALEQLSHNTNPQLVVESLLFRLNKHIS